MSINVDGVDASKPKAAWADRVNEYVADSWVRAVGLPSEFVAHVVLGAWSGGLDAPRALLCAAGWHENVPAPP